jgi:hypothetical protein
METITKEQISSGDPVEIRLKRRLRIIRLLFFTRSLAKDDVYAIHNNLIPEGMSVKDWKVNYAVCDNKTYYSVTSKSQMPEQIARNSEKQPLEELMAITLKLIDFAEKEIKSLEEASEAMKGQKADHITITNKEEQS